MRAAAFLREAIEGFHRGEALAQLARARDPGADVEPSSVAYAHRLLSNEGADALAEVRERGELPEDEVQWLGEQRAAMRQMLALSRTERAARARLMAATTPTGGRLSLGEELSRIALTGDLRSREETGRALESVLRPLAQARASAHLGVESLGYVEIARERPEREQEQPATSSLLIVSAFEPDVLSPPRRDLPELPWLLEARTFLERTDAAAEDAVRFLTRHLHARGGTGAIPWHTLLGALRAYELDSEIGHKQRWLRTAGWLRGLGFEEAMSARLRAETDHGAALPVGQALGLHVPRDVRLTQASRDFGVVSDLCAAEAVARGLSHALTHIALPAELRYPIGPSTAGAIGLFGMLAWTDRAQLTRLQGLTSAQAERIGRIGRSALLLWARLVSALAVMPATEPAQPEARLELLCEAAGRALAVRVEPGIAGVFVPDRVSARARALELLAGLAGALGLRERLDADWYRNPRAGDLLSGLAQRGNRLSPAGMCGELGRSLSEASASALELVA